MHVQVDNVSFAYDAEPVLQDVTLHIPVHDYVGIVGPNGAGKTTLLKIILGLLKPTTGTANVSGRIGYVPQKATNFDPRFPATVFEVVVMGRYGLRGMLHRTTSEDRARARTALCQVDMEEYEQRLIGDLSGGQQQRVFIARALAGEPEIIFLDEPTTGVDQKTQDEFYELLRKLNEEQGLTLVLVTHDVHRVTKEAKYIICVDKKLICDTSPEEFLKHAHTFPI